MAATPEGGRSTSPLLVRDLHVATCTSATLQHQLPIHRGLPGAEPLVAILAESESAGHLFFKARRSTNRYLDDRYSATARSGS